MFNDNFLGNKLYELRKKANLSQEDFAEKLNVSRQAVSKWECGDALPDTENLIKISKLYGVSLDELVGNINPNQVQNDQPNQDDSPQKNNEASPKSEHKSEIQIDEVGVHISRENEIHINDDVHFDDVDTNIIVHIETSQTPQEKKITLRLLEYLPYPILITIAYLLWGFLWNGWAVGWTLYMTIPVYYSVLECIKKKKASHFAYPVLVAFIYLFMGMQWSYWHPHWISFLSIPIYYAITSAIEKP